MKWWHFLTSWENSWNVLSPAMNCIIILRVSEYHDLKSLLLFSVNKCQFLLSERALFFVAGPKYGCTPVWREICVTPYWQPLRATLTPMLERSRTRMENWHHFRQGNKKSYVLRVILLKVDNVEIGSRHGGIYNWCSAFKPLGNQENPKALHC